ncbi:MAG TPA: response regulator [Candidatus Binatia bacterium]
MARVLIVDDDADSLLALRAVLVSNGFEVECAHQGLEAIEVADVFHPDLLISDLLMPVMDGYTLLSRWKEDPSLQQIPFIVFTGAYTEGEDESLALDLGADAFLTKSRDVDELLDTVDRVLRNSVASPARPPADADSSVLRDYNRTLLRKLEDKMRQLEQSHRSLQMHHEARQHLEVRLSDSEARFHELAQSVPQAFWIGSSSIEEVLYVSPAYETIWGRSRESLYADGTSWLEAVHPDDRDRIAHLAFEHTQNGERQAEFRIRRPDGSERWVLTRTFPMEGNETRAVPCIVGVTEDITERRSTEETRRVLEAKVAQAQKLEAVSTLATGIAHDFSNILSVVAGNAELALMDPGLPEPARASLHEISKAADRAVRLMRQLLTFSRGDARPLSAAPLRNLVESALPALRANVPAGIELVVRFAETIPNVLSGPVFLEHILGSLVSNACEAVGGQGQIRIVVDTAPETVARGCARIFVQDNGCGMDEDTQRRVFEPFFTTRSSERHQGLGLSVVHGLVTQMNGSVTVRSQPGAGTTFELLFPDAGALDAAAQNAAPVPPGTAAAAAAINGHQLGHVLYLDDEEALVHLAERMFPELGLRVTGFSRPEDAIEAVRADPTGYDLVVTDYNMPRISGLRVAREMSMLSPGLPVLLMSGTISAELREEAERAGVHHLVRKPDTIDQLCETVADVLKQARAPSTAPGGGMPAAG